jgi:hypothetical protein
VSVEEEVVRILRERFPSVPFEFSSEGDWIARLPAPYPDLGTLEICEDDAEVTFYLGEVAHGHFYPQDKKAPTADRKMAEDLAHFLEELFEDRVLMRKGSLVSSWAYVRDGELKLKRSGDHFLWSRKLAPRAG